MLRPISSIVKGVATCVARNVALNFARGVARTIAARNIAPNETEPSQAVVADLPIMETSRAVVADLPIMEPSQVLAHLISRGGMAHVEKLWLNGTALNDDHSAPFDDQLIVIPLLADRQ